ncbi:hypothetical protein ACLIA0_05275 [Bacillaceae bacterium W0354]
MNNPQRKLVIFAFVFVIILASSYLIYNYFNQEHEAKIAINTFYAYEQEGKFADSWAMFHPYMKEKFSKGHYLQDRVHVFFNHFDVETFNYEIGQLSEKNDWIFEDGADPIDVYVATVTKYGNFSLTQNVYTTKVEGKWTILWDYKK